MAEDFADAAQRHFEDADLLKSNARLDGAGHHYGVSGECAVKAVCVEETQSFAMKHFDTAPARDLRTAAIPDLVGRKGQLIQPLLPTLFTGWSVHDRYSSTGHLNQGQVDQWRLDAQSVLNVLQGV